MLPDLKNDNLKLIFNKVQSETADTINNYLGNYGKKIQDDLTFSTSLDQSLQELIGFGNALTFITNNLSNDIKSYQEKHPSLAKEVEKVAKSSLLKTISAGYLENALMVMDNISSEFNDTREEKDIPEMEQIKQIQNVIKFHLNAERSR
ncbi:MAG: hypothetical protein RIC95_09505 [Vicingaceae bacterium]